MCEESETVGSTSRKCSQERAGRAFDESSMDRLPHSAFQIEWGGASWRIWRMQKWTPPVRARCAATICPSWRPTCGAPCSRGSGSWTRNARPESLSRGGKLPTPPPHPIPLALEVLHPTPHPAHQPTIKPTRTPIYQPANQPTPTHASPHQQKASQAIPNQPMSTQSSSQPKRHTKTASPVGQLAPSHPQQTDRPTYHQPTNN